jgi:hypothetical protein
MQSPDDPADLELTPDQMRAMGRAVLDRLIDHIASLDDQLACGDVHAEDLCRAMREPPPEHGTAPPRPATWPTSRAAASSRPRWPT